MVLAMDGALSNDLAPVVDPVSHAQPPSGSGGQQAVQVRHRAAMPQNGMTDPVYGICVTYHLTVIVDGLRTAQRAARKRSQIRWNPPLPEDRLPEGETRGVHRPSFRFSDHLASTVDASG